MFIYPAIDLYEGKAVRLFKGDYAQMEVFSGNPPEVAKDLRAAVQRTYILLTLRVQKTEKRRILTRL